MAPEVNEPPALSSMSWCRLKNQPKLNLDEKAYEINLLLVLQGFTAQFVSKEQYEQLLFILGQKANNFTGT